MAAPGNHAATHDRGNKKRPSREGLFIWTSRRPYIRTSTSHGLHRIDLSVAHLHVVAIAHIRVVALGHRGVLAVVQPHHDPPGIAPIIGTLADLVADDTAGHRTDHRGSLAAVTLADGAAKHAAGHGADHRTKHTAVAIAVVDVHRLHILHHAAALAAAVAAAIALPVTLPI